MSSKNHTFLYVQKDSESQPELIDVEMGGRRLLCFARDFDGTVAFYRDILEFQMIYDRVSEWGRRSALFNAGSAGLIEIIPLPPGRKASAPKGTWMRCRVDNVGDWYLRLREKGVQISGEVAGSSSALRSFSVTDPNGYVVNYVSRRRPRA